MFDENIYRMQNAYPYIAHASLPCVFVMLKDAEIAALASGKKKGPYAEGAAERIGKAMEKLSGKCFVSVDTASPTDAPRYLSSSRGMVRSGIGAWKILCESAKVRKLASEGKVSCVTVRPFRVFDVPREFRLFIRKGELLAMSQRFLVRHFHRLQRRKEEYFEIAEAFWKKNKGIIPAEDFALDIYITSAKEVLILDLNCWGDPTDHLMLRSWEENPEKPLGCLIVPPPAQLSGSVNVSF